MLSTLTHTVWDTDLRRGASLKERLDMFSEHETKLYTGDWKGTPCQDTCFLSFDACDEPVLHVARSVRRAGENVFLLLVADKSGDLTALFRPGIRPGGVLFRPVQNTHLRELLEEIDEEMERLAKSETDDMFLLKSEGTSRRIPFRDILFFEASNKKVTLRTPGQEISYYDSIDNLTSVLPPYFVRCHRSFIVNIRKIEELRGPEMELKLTGGLRIPFSRSQSETIRQAVKNSEFGVRNSE